MTKYIGILFVAMTIYACGKLELKPLPPVANKVSISTNVVSSISHNSAVVGGTVNSVGESAMLERGVCYATTQNPTVRNPKLKDASLGAGSFQLTLQGLTADTKYFVRAYTVSAKDTAYGENLEFTTTPLVPTITTKAVDAVTYANAVVTTSITSIGAGPLTLRGVCWSTSPNPTISNEKSVDALTTGDINSKIIGLKQNTLYYVKAYAANSFGITYGKELSFTTPVLTTEDLNQIQFINNNIGFIAGNRVILKTINGGDTWIKIRESTKINFTSIRFENENLGYAGGNDDTYSHLYKTTDGGLTWVEVSGGATNEGIRIVAIFTMGTNKVTYLENYYSNPIKGIVNSSIDGGANWVKSSKSSTSGLLCGDLNSSGVLHIGGVAPFYNTSLFSYPFFSNGSNEILNSVSDDKAIIYGIDMYGNNKGFAVGESGKYFASSNGGANWTMRTISGYTKETLNAVQFKDDQNGFIAGTNGLFLVSTDGGFSWFKEITNYTGKYRSIAIKLDGTVFAVGEKGEIFRRQF
jgi:photosystem II stability/assembly factor-like uncharacterized protein